MTLTVKSLRATRRVVRLRMPFSYGDIRVTEMPEAQLELEIETAGSTVIGRSAQMMAPRWFNKKPDLSPAATIDELGESVKSAVRNAVGLSGSVARVADTIRAASVAEQVPNGVPLLAAGFGAALVEAALIDAACRAADMPFHAAAKADLFGLAALAPEDPGKDYLEGHLAGIGERRDILVRHTVGYRSPLTDIEAKDDDPGDGLPASLERAISQTGVHWFKIKLKGHVDEDIDWLEAVDAVIARQVPAYRASLDANEQYQPENLAELLRRLEQEPGLSRMRRAIAFIEQPFPREIALSETCRLPKTDIPLVIDESDDSDDAVLRAFALGWSGTSAKSCKGVLHALVNAARVARRRSLGHRAMITAEDLSCQPYLALHQDTLMAAAIGAAHVERNGHQFGGALQGFDAAASETILERHSDLYRPLDGRPCLSIEDGRISFGSLNAPGFGSIRQIGNIGTIFAEAAQ